MPAIDLKATGWTTLFQHKNTVVLPDQLTKKWWDKKKSVVAKMTRATGVGAALDEVQDAFKKVAFPEFNPHPTLVKEGVDSVKKFITSSPVKKLHDALKDLKNLAREEAKELKKNVLTKGTAKTLEEIEEAADTLMVCANTNSLTESLRRAMEAWQKGQSDRDIRMAPTTLAAAGKAGAKIPAELANIRKLLGDMVDDNDDEGRNKVANGIRDLCRDLTQPLGNLLKAEAAGVGLQNFNKDAFVALSKQLVPISNAQGTEFAKGLSKAQMTALTKKMEDWCREYSRITGQVTIVSMPKV